ncbi:MAG: WecB/TagA/CpsF family glycosyltransferase [Chloroflexota bacterium]|nr:WecB/TagA/CpsF family glycosyltransferase [Chloroflexota bacterium]
MSERASVLGLPVDAISPDALRQSLLQIARGDRLTHLVTLNPEQVIAARRDEQMRSAITAADIVTADGIGIVLALRAQGKTVPSRITGVALGDELARSAIPTFLLGGRPGAAELAADRLRERFPGAKIVGAWSGGRSSPEDDNASLKRIRESGAVAVLVAYGAAGQLAWIERNRDALEGIGIRIAIGVGGALDYAAGIVQQPPAWARRFGIEWTIRLLREPWRWRRQVVLPVFAVLALLEAVQVRLGRR